MDVALLGANTNVVPVAEELQAYYEQHYNEQRPDGVRAQSYARIVYRNVYPNIDWVLYTRNGELKYDFVVHPGGNPALIQLQYKGATTLQLKDGALTASTPMGSITEQAPYSYDAATRKAIASAYKLQGDVLSFDVAQAKGGIVIDPNLSWATYYGGSANEADDPKVITTDASGNVYIAASTENLTNMATIGAYQTSMSNSSKNGLIVKFNSAGARQWGTYYGGNSYDQLNDILYSSNAIYVAGSSFSTTGMATTGAFQTTKSGPSNGANTILAKFDLNGSRQWATYYGEGGQIGGFNSSVLAADPSGNIYMRTQSVVAATPGAYQTVAVRGDAMLTKFNPSGNRLWATYFGGDSLDNASAVACDASGNVYLVGATKSVNGIATTGAYQSARNFPYQDGDQFLAKFSSSGSLLWGTYHSHGAGVGSMVCDNNGDVYLGGITHSINNIATVGSHWSNHTSNGSSYNGFLIKFSNSGTKQWGTYFGAIVRDIALSTQNNLYVTGMYDSTWAPIPVITANAHRSTLPFVQGGFYSILNSSGNLLYGSYLPGNANDDPYGITVSSSNSMHLVGRTGSTSGLVTTGAHQTTYGGGSWDLFVAKFDDDTSVYLNTPFNDTLLCTDTIIHVPYTVSAPFNTGNTFTVQLSNATGSFIAPVNIGTVTATGSGSITCNVPIGTLAGTGYRIRIVSSSPMRTSNDNGKTIEFISRPNITASANTPVCAGSTLTLSSTTGPVGSAYAWRGPNGFTASGATATITSVAVINAGVYTVEVNNLGCKRISNIPVTVNPTPAVPVASVAQPICKGGVIALSATSTPGATYQWSGPLSYTSTLQNPTISPAATNMSGTYSVVASLGNCPSAAANVVVTVNKVADIGAYASPNDTVCAGEILTLVGFPQSGGTSPTFEWYKNGLPVTTNTVYSSNTVSTGDKFWCVMTATGVCPTTLTLTSDTITITVLNVKYTPKVKITASPAVTGDPAQTVEFKANPLYGGMTPTYQWYRNGVKLAGISGATYTTNGVYMGTVVSVEMTSNHACADVLLAADTVSINFPTSVKDHDKNTTASLYPNPNKGSFTIAGITAGEVQLNIINALGQTVYSKTQRDVAGTMQVQATLPPGAYMVRVVADGKVQVLRFNAAL